MQEAASKSRLAAKAGMKSTLGGVEDAQEYAAANTPEALAAREEKERLAREKRYAAMTDEQRSAQLQNTQAAHTAELDNVLANKGVLGMGTSPMEQLDARAAVQEEERKERRRKELQGALSPDRLKMMGGMTSRYR